MKEILELLQALQKKCESQHINYGLFICNQPHAITGAANFTLEEITIMIETITRNLPYEQVSFIQHIVGLVADEKKKKEENKLIKN